MAMRGSRRIPHAILPSGRNWKLNAKPVLLLHCDGADESTTFKDSSPSNHTVTAQDDAQVDTAESKRGGASALFDGSDYLSIPDSADWDISTNFTIDFWAKHSALLSIETYISQFEDVDNIWSLRHTVGSGLQFFIISGGSAIVNTGAAGEISDNSWYHIAMCKVGDEYGLYRNGTQIAHTSDADMDTFTGSLYIGIRGDDQLPFLGNMDEIRIVKNANVFGAAPVVGLSDTIRVPFQPYISWR